MAAKIPSVVDKNTKKPVIHVGFRGTSKWIKKKNTGPANSVTRAGAIIFTREFGRIEPLKMLEVNRLIMALMNLVSDRILTCAG